MLQTLNTFLVYQGDFLLLLGLVVTACLILRQKLPARPGTKCVPCRILLAAIGLTLVGGLIAEWATRDRINTLKQIFSGFGPTYAMELAAEGHNQITLDTPADDPTYLTLIGYQKKWLAANPMIADIYTFRRDEAGQVRLIVDSETDYDHNGRFEGDRESRTPIGEIYDEATPAFQRALDGEGSFDSQIISDRWGVWVSSYSPIYGKDGIVEGAVGVDYPAAAWIGTVAGTRFLVLGITLVIIAILLSSAVFIGLLRAEIEERKETLARLEAASESAFAASAAKSEFLAVMSHEVRTPLSAIMGFASILADSELNESQRRYVDTINRAGSGLVDLLNGILDYTKAESGSLKLERIAWAPALLIFESMELMSARAAEKNVALNFENQLPGTLTLFGDPTRVRQIVLNLLSNALKFTDRGSVTVRASWRPDRDRPDRGQLTLDVIDTGVGIPPQKIPLLFRAFSQADASTTRSHGGTGLGLAICKRLTDLMGGTIGLTSVPGRGTTFSFTLESDAAEACGLGHRPGAGAAPTLPVWNRVLVVDDTKLNRELLKVMLRRLGLEADLASSGPEAVRFAADTRYGIIFTDLEMPEMDGFATARQIRAGETGGHRVPIVAVSAMTAAGTREKCIASGMDDYLTKPVYLPALKSVLEAQLPHFKAQAAPEAQPQARNVAA